MDSDLRVDGISGLRVADASATPAPVSANTDATVYAIAERTTELIRGRRLTGTGSRLIAAAGLSGDG